MTVTPKYDLESLSIRANDRKIPTEELGWIPSFPVDTPDEMLREAFDKHGVLLVKNAMPREFIMDIRRRFFAKIAPTGILKEGSEPVDGIFCGENEEYYRWPQMIQEGGQEWEKDSYPDIVARLQKEESWNEFCNNPWLVKLVGRLKPSFEEPFCLRRQILRTNVPHSPAATILHYDQRFLRHGPPTFVTAWVPVGDCDPISGGLIYLENSTEIGERMEQEFERQAKVLNYTSEEFKNAYNPNMSNAYLDVVEFAKNEGAGRKWLIADFEAGDAVFHQAFTIHAASENQSPTNVIRVSADLRFADRKAMFDPRWNVPLDVHDGL